VSGIALRAARQGSALIALLREAWTEYEHDHGRYLAVAMVYYAIVSLVPLLLLLLSALGLLLRFSQVAAGLQQQVLGRVEASFGPQLRVLIEELLKTLQQDSIVATVVGLISLIVTASLLFRHLRLSFRAIWNYAPPLISGPLLVVVRATLREQLIALAMVLVGGTLLVAALTLLALAQWLNGLMINLPLTNRLLGWTLTSLSPFALALITFGLLFKFLPPRPLRLRDVWLATLLCAIAWWAAGQLLTLYGVLFGNSPSAYGALGGLLVVMLWMNIVSQVLFLGAELCKVVAGEERAKLSGGEL
jgi:membrane protein